MQKRVILSAALFDVTIKRLCQQLIENHQDFTDTVLIGLQPRGVILSKIIKDQIREWTSIQLPLGHLDTTFYRDDFRQRESPKKANETKIEFEIENKKVILVDDVLFTGRSERAAMDALLAFGRPRIVELLVLVNRKYSRHLPIEPDYVGKDVNTVATQKVLVEWIEQGGKSNSVMLVEQE